MTISYALPATKRPVVVSPENASCAAAPCSVDRGARVTTDNRPEAGRALRRAIDDLESLLFGAVIDIGPSRREALQRPAGQKSPVLRGDSL